jgi:hypothetical protein
MIFIKKNFCLAIALLISAFSVGQSLSPQVIVSDGNYLTSAGGSISYSIGEPVSETTFSGSHILTQGFQQPFSVSLTAVPENTDASFFVFPNPVKDAFTIDFGKSAIGVYTISISDVTGRLIQRKEVEINNSSFEQPISLAENDNGIYLISISNKEKTYTRSFKIIKQN